MNENDDNGFFPGADDDRGDIINVPETESDGPEDELAAEGMTESNETIENSGKGPSVLQAQDDSSPKGEIYLKSAAGSEDKPAPAVWSKKHIVVIAAVCVVSAVIGGILGGMTAYRLISGHDIPATATVIDEPSSDMITIATTETTASRETETQESALAVSETQVSTAVDQTTSATTAPATTAAPVTQSVSPNVKTTMTASEVYSKYVNTVVGISSQVRVSTSFFGTTVGTSTGSGFLITADGYIVTNYHVIEGALSTLVSLYGGEQYEASVVGYEESNDIAVLKIDAQDLNFAVFGSSDDLVVGDSVLIIGNPLGDLTYSLTSGVVSALDRSINTGSRVVNMHQTDAAINKGNSGGPVFDLNGKVIGIASAKYTSDSAEGLSFFIPSSDILSYINDIIAYGYVRGQASIGVSVQTLTLRTAQRYGLVPGVYIAAVGEGTPAAEAGLSAGDVIVAAENTSVSTVEELSLLLSAKSAGDMLSVTVNRDSSEFSVDLRLGEKVPAAARTDSPSVVDI